MRKVIPRLRVLAGPNGSGKSTLFVKLRSTPKVPFGYCLNPDEIDREFAAAGRFYFGTLGTLLTDERLTTFVAEHALAAKISGPLPRVDGKTLVVPPDFRPGYFTTILCDLFRRDWVSQRESFTFETVFSSEDKVDGMRSALDAGFRTYLYYVCTDAASINEGRVASRVRKGGHAVPSATLRQRYERTLGLLPAAIAASSRAYLFDNSAASHQLVVEYEDNRLVRRADVLPTWVASHPTLRVD